MAAISGLAGLLIPIHEQQRGLHFSAEFQQCQSQRYRDFELFDFIPKRRLFSLTGLILNIQLALFPLLPMHRGFGGVWFWVSLASKMVKYGFQNTQIAQELVFTKGLYFAESFFAYNYVLAKPEGPVRRICGAREVVLVWGWFFFFLNLFKFHLYF